MRTPEERQKHYEVLLERVEEVLVENVARDDALQAVCMLIDEEIPKCDWVGFYLVDPETEDELVLGPYVGEETEHARIPFGLGICGTAAKTRSTIVVDDVRNVPSYLCCSPEVRSEIVVPLIKHGEVVGQLDIDSHTEAAFGAAERELFEGICRHVLRLF